MGVASDTDFEDENHVEHVLPLARTLLDEGLLHAVVLGDLLVKGVSGTCRVSRQSKGETRRTQSPPYGIAAYGG